MNVRTLRGITTVAMLGSLMIVPVSAEAQAQSDAGLSPRALFYKDISKDKSVDSVATTPQAKKPQGPTQPEGPAVVRIFVKLFEPGGVFSEVPPTRVFRSGERIRLALTSSKPGYFYLATVGSSGKVQIVVPLQGEGRVLIQANQTCDFPRFPGVLEFGGEVGNEEIYAFFSEAPLDVLDFGEGRRVPVGSGTRVAAVASRDLFRVEEDPKSIFVAGASGTPHIVQKLTLVHR